jgi:hypothetical protein
MAISQAEFGAAWWVPKLAVVAYLCLAATFTRLGQPDGISPSRMAEMLEVDKAGPKVRC